MTFRFARPGTLSSGAQVSPDTQAAAALQEYHSTNYSLAGTPLQPRASDQLEPLNRPLDISDGEVMRGDGRFLPPGVTVADTVTKTADTMEQATMRAETLNTNRLGAQAANDVQRAVAFQQVAAPAGLRQQHMDRVRGQEGLANNLQYRSGAFLDHEMMAQLDERAAQGDTRPLEVLKHMAARMGGAPNLGGMPINA